MKTKLTAQHERKLFLGLYDSKRGAISEIKRDIRSNLDKVTATRCQYCGFTGAKDSFDHFLQKARLPELSLFAPNLIPCCFSCNNKRGTRSAFTPNGTRQLLHFYDDDVDSMPEVLSADVEITGNGDPVVKYSVGASAHPLVDVYRSHFDVLGLASRYQDEASHQFDVIRANVARFMDITRQSATTVLLDWAQTQSHTYGRNDFMAALYRGIAASPQAMRWLVP
jgi:hypothetical protein